MADRDLTINLRFAKEAAERRAREFHEGERRRIEEDGEAQARVDKQYIAAVKMKMRAINQLAREIERRIKERENAEKLSQKAIDDGDAQVRKNEMARLRRAIQARYEAHARIATADKKFAREVADEGDRQARRYRESWERAEAARLDASRRTFRASIADLERFRKETLASLGGAGIGQGAPKKSLAGWVVEEGKKLAAANVRLSDAIWKAEDARVRRHMAAWTQRWEAEGEKLRGMLAYDPKAHAALRAEIREEERRAEFDNEAMRKQFARRRFDSFIAEANEKAALSKKYTEDALDLTKKAAEAEKKGLKDTAAIRRRFAATYAEMAKGAAAESVKAAKQASEIVKEVAKGEGFAVRDSLKGTIAVTRQLADETVKGARKGEQAVKDSSRSAGEVQRSELKKTDAEAKKHSGQVSILAQQYLAMRTAERTLRLLKEGWQAVVESSAQAGRYVEKMAEDTARVRDALTEVHRMEGKTPSFAATAEELKNFSDMGVTSDFGIRGKTEWIAQAAGMIQPAQLAPGQKAESYRMTLDQSKELQKFAMQAAAAQGIDVEPAMLLMSVIAGKAPVDPRTGKVDTDAVKDTFAKNFGLMATEKGHTSQDVRQFAEAAQILVQSGGGIKDINRIAIQHAAQTEIGPGRSRVNLEALYRGIDQLDEKKWDALGIAYESVLKMDDEQRLAAVTKAIEAKALESVGGRYDSAGHQFTVERSTARQLAFNQSHELNAFMSHLNGGVRGGIYEQRRAEQQAGGRGVMERRIAEYMQSPQGRARAEQTGLEADRAQRAADRGSEEFGIFRTQVARRIAQGGELEEGEKLFDAWATSNTQKLGFGNREELLQFRMQGQELRKRLQKLADEGSEDALAYLKAEGHMLTPNPSYPIADSAAQERAYGKLLGLERGADARRANKQAPFPSDLAVHNAAMKRALTNLQSRGEIPPRLTLQQVQTHGDHEANGGVPVPGEHVFVDTPGRGEAMRAALARHAAEIEAEQRKLHGGDNEAILRGLAPPSNAAANDAHDARMRADAAANQPAVDAAAAGLRSVPPAAPRPRAGGFGVTIPAVTTVQSGDRHRGGLRSVAATPPRPGPRGFSVTIPAVTTVQTERHGGLRSLPHAATLASEMVAHAAHARARPSGIHVIPGSGTRRHRTPPWRFHALKDGEFAMASRRGDGHLDIALPGSNRRAKSWLTPGADHHLAARFRPGGGADRMRGSRYIEILTDADRKRRAEHAANTAALSAPRRAAQAAAAAAAARRKADMDRAHADDWAVAHSHMDENAADLAYFRNRNAMPAARPPIPTPQFPDYGFGHGPVARATRGMLRPSGPMSPTQAPAPGTYPKRYGHIDHDPVPAGWWFSQNNHAPNGLPGANAIQGAVGGGLSEVARLLKQVVHPPVPSPAPGKPTTASMRN